MNVYVESNFVLELTLLQGEQESCERILSLCEQGHATLIIPAYALAEPNETLIRRDLERKELAPKVGKALRELSRSIPYETEATTFQEVVSLLTRSGSEERQRLTTIRNRLLQAAEIIPLDRDVLASAADFETQFKRPQDTLVFASVLQHLKVKSSVPFSACFITRDEHFEDVDIRNLLAEYNCRTMTQFGIGLSYIQSQL